MNTKSSPDVASPRAIGSADLNWALAQGWNDFRQKRGDLILLPFIYAIVSILASAFAFQSSLFPLIFPMVGGFALIGPITTAGFFELARRRELGLESSWRHFFDPLQGRPRMPILVLSVILAGMFLLWMIVAKAVYTATLGTLAPATPAAFIVALFNTPQGWTMIVVGNVLGALFAVLTLAISAFSFPMVVDKSTDPFTAIAASVRAFRRNPGTMIGWGLRVVVILALGALPLFIGLLVAMPVLGYATWHLYTRAIAR